jgi:uncharacterized protein (DUF2062 family)
VSDAVAPVDNMSDDGDKTWWQRTKANVNKILAQNLTPERLAMSIVVGIIGGLFPIPGVTTLVVMLLAAGISVNLPAATLLNVLLTPVELAMVPVFLYLGEFVIGMDHISLAPSTIMQALKEDLWQGLAQYGGAMGYAVLGWACWAPPFGAMTYFVLVPILRLVLSPRKKTVVTPRFVSS